MTATPSLQAIREVNPSSTSRHFVAAVAVELAARLSLRG